jgi:hypothetical protein
MVLLLLKDSIALIDELRLLGLVAPVVLLRRNDETGTVLVEDTVSVRLCVVAGSPFVVVSFVDACCFGFFVRLVERTMGLTGELYTKEGSTPAGGGSATGGAIVLLGISEVGAGLG